LGILEARVLANSIHESVQSLSRSEFVARFPGYYLLLAPPKHAEGIGFRTMVADPDSDDGEGEERVDLESASEVLAVKKSPGNPYADRISIGRARNCDLVLRDASVSKLHAHFITREPSHELELVDLGSHNGTLVDGKPLAANQALIVRPGCVLRFGNAVATFVDAQRLFDLLSFGA
jgi:hypothetical protein